MVLRQEKLWVEIHAVTSLDFKLQASTAAANVSEKICPFFWASTFCWLFIVWFGIDFFLLDVGVSGQLALGVITLCQKNSPASLNSIQNSITFNFLPVLHFRSSPALFLVVA